MRKVAYVLTTLLITIACLTSIGAAFQVGYVLDPETNRRVPSPLGYVYEREIRDVGLDNPLDLFIDPDDNIYVVDTWNNRIVKLDPAGNILHTYGDRRGEGALNRPEGVHVDSESNVWVADTQNSRVVRFNPEGEVTLVLEQPKHEILGDDFQYRPTKLTVDNRDHVYVINSNDYRGIVDLDLQGNFVEFFAHNPVGWSLRRLMIRLFATEAQKERFARDLPPPHSNIFLRDDGFFYTTTIYETRNQIKRLSPVGVNVHPEGFYGERIRQGWQWVMPRFIDLTVNQYGVISALDSSSSKVYQYDQEGNLLLVFGGKGEGKGYVSHAASIDVDSNGLLYILDKDRARIQIFRPTEFANLVHAATQLYMDGRYDEAAVPWSQVIELNSNYTMGYVGMGKVYHRKEDYDMAMKYYELGNDKAGYSKSFSEKRLITLRQNFGTLILSVIGIIVLIVVIVKLIRRVLEKPDEETGPFGRAVKLIYLCLFHPGEGFLRAKEEVSLLSSFILLFLFLAARFITLKFTHFPLQSVDPAKVHELVEVGRMLLPFGLWVFANWSVTAIAGSEANLRDIFVGSSICVVPYIIVVPLLTLFSHVCCAHEAGLYASILSIMNFAQIFMFLSMVRVMHNYNWKRTIGISILSIICMAFFVGGAALVYGLINQMVDFVKEVIIEISIR
ncbi:MAG: NHL repeat-containing protein [Limnochordia bacterium]|nr:NHL repeat-containing protein [Limnochordia bacterium]MDD2629235.1 NHL repeat-containing protein [Limnochordia bacterium]MDD4518729.1 NHL repeat-containing protein [Limnochordia bacterium]